MRDNTVARLGELVLLVSLVVTTFTAAASAVGARRRSQRLVEASVLTPTPRRACSHWRRP